MGWLTVVDTNLLARVLAPTPDSQNAPLVESNAASEEEQAAEAADQDDGKCQALLFLVEMSLTVSTDKENRPRRKARLGKKPEGKSSHPLVIVKKEMSDGCVERAVKNKETTELSELTSLDFVETEVADFHKFCRGWEREVKLSKIGQGSFATVLKMELTKEPGQYSIWKVMPIKPSKGSGSRPSSLQTFIKDAATEVKTLVAMSDIDGFVQFRSAHVVKGSVPDQIGKAHNAWAEALDPRDAWYGTDMSAEYSSKSQLWLLMEMTDAGQDIDSMHRTARSQRKLYSIHDTSDVFWGIAEALMRGEMQAEFEHRDLHLGNVCIKIRDKPIDLTPEHGIPRSSKHEVTLIDYTQSRLTLESGEVLATAIDESIFRQIDSDPDAQRQYNVYRVMRDIVKKEKKPGVTISQMWKEYVPMTNVLWLHHILRELMTMTRTTSRTYEEAVMNVDLFSLQTKLDPDIREGVKYYSAREVVSEFLANH